MYVLRSSLVILAVAATSVAFPGQGPPKGYSELNDYAKAIGKVYFGTAADIPGPGLQDNAYLAVLNNTHEVGQLTPTNYMKVFVPLGVPAHIEYAKNTSTSLPSRNVMSSTTPAATTSSTSPPRTTGSFAATI